MADAAVSNRFPFDTILLGCEQEDDKVSLNEHGVGSSCGVVGLLSNEELYVLEPEGVLDSVGNDLAVFA